MIEGIVMKKTITKYLVKNVGWFVSIISFALLVIHSFSLMKVTIDNYTILLLVIVVVAPYLNNIKKLRYNGFEAEINNTDIDKVKNEIKDTDNMRSEGITMNREFSKNKDYIMPKSHDTILALANIRMEMEKYIIKLYKFETNKDNQSFMSMIDELSKMEVLPFHIVGPLKEIVILCNRALHGEKINTKIGNELIEIGMKILCFLKNSLSRRYDGSVNTIDVDYEVIEQHMRISYKVISMVPCHNKPRKNIRILTHKELNEFLDDYNEYSEFVVSIQILDNMDSPID